MDVDVPAEVRDLLASRRKHEEIERRLRLEKKRAEAREQAEHLRKVAPLVRRARSWARAFAREQRLPERGVEIFKLEGSKAFVMPSGRLVLRCWSKYCGWPEARPKYVPIAFFEALVDVIESGAVWDHVRGGGAR